MERTLIILKPDAVQRGLIGEILQRLERRGLRLAALKFATIAPEGFGAYAREPFLIGETLAWRDAEAKKISLGMTNPANAAPGTIRGDLAVETGRNLIHGSANADDATREVALFFRPEEIQSWERSTDRWIQE